MSECMISKNYLLGAKISFLIISFIIGIIAITVQNDIWPFLQTTVPIQKDSNVWFLLTGIVGFLLPLSWLIKDWSIITIRYSLLAIIIMLALQLITEWTVSRYFFISMVIPTSILYVGYRILQLVNLQRVLFKTSYPTKKSKLFRQAVWGANLFFWSILWIKLTFFTFPQIIYQIF